MGVLAVRGIPETYPGGSMGYRSPRRIFLIIGPYNLVWSEIEESEQFCLDQWFSTLPTTPDMYIFKKSHAPIKLEFSLYLDFRRPANIGQPL